MAGMDMSKPIGPLPTGAWAAIVAAGVGIVWYTRTHGSSSSTTPVDPTTLADSVGAGPTAFTAVDPSPQPSSNAASFTDNGTWSVAAITWGIAHGLQPTIVDSAVRDYINGQNLSGQEQAIIDQILKALGPPPETLTPYQRPPSSTPPVTPGGPPSPPPPPPVTKPPPVTSKPPVPTPAGKWFIVAAWPARDSTLYGIAQDAYGNGNQWPTLFNANRVGVVLPDGSQGWISNPNLIYAGRKVWAPNAN